MTTLKFTIKKNVTLPLLKIVANSTRYFKMTGAMFIGKEIEGGRKDAAGNPQKPATLAHCVDLETGEEGQFIVSHVLYSELNGAYPDDSYVGKSFAFSFTRPAGKKYNLVTIAEIEVQAEEGNVAEAEKPKGKK